MNITLPPDSNRPVSWSIVYEDDSVVQSIDITWNEQAILQQIENEVFYFSTKRIQDFFCEYQGQRVRFTAPEPVYYFAYTRMRSAIYAGQTTWMHTTFGYFLKGLCVTLEISPQRITQKVQYTAHVFDS